MKDRIRALMLNRSGRFTSLPNRTEGDCFTVLLGFAGGQQNRPSADLRPRAFAVSLRLGFDLSASWKYFSPTSVQLKSEINGAFLCKRHQMQHLEFCTTLLGRGSSLRARHSHNDGGYQYETPFMINCLTNASKSDVRTRGSFPFALTEMTVMQATDN
jgi:hypothetical protein